MARKSCIAAGLVLAWSSLAGAQTAPRPETPETAAAMERAKRAAAGPMRAILQASKAPVRRKAGEADGPAVAASAPASEAATPTVQRLAVARVRSSAEGVGAADGGAGSGPAAAAVAVEVVMPPPVPEAVVTALVLPASALASSAGAEVAPLAPSVQAAAAVALPKLVAAQSLSATLPAVLVQPRLVNMVEPVIPMRLMDIAPRVSQVQADLMLRADGTVAEVLLVQPVPRAWQRLLTEALAQWRFEPLAAARSHRVQLVFGEP